MTAPIVKLGDDFKKVCEEFEQSMTRGLELIRAAEAMMDKALREKVSRERGRSGAVMTAPIVKIGADAMKAFAEFEASFRKLRELIERQEGEP